MEIETGWRTYKHFLLENVLGCRLVVGEHICFSWRTYLASGWRTFLGLENCGGIKLVLIAGRSGADLCVGLRDSSFCTKVFRKGECSLGRHLLGYI